MAAKQLLPVYGGSAAVWSAALLFFQLALLAGYAYATWAKPRLHAAMACVMVLSVILRSSGPTVAPPAGIAPVLSVLWSLTLSIGVPFAVIAAGSTLLQRWAGSYKLYAISNIGSLLALLAYPLVVEPWIGLQGQHWMWTGGVLLYAALILVCVVCVRSAPPSASADQGMQQRPGMSSLLWWTTWAALGSALLSATTNQICQEVASIPFLWILPLAIYLASFIAVFQGGNHWWMRPSVWNLLAPVAIGAAVSFYVAGLQFSYAYSLTADLAVLAVCLMLCHGELASSKPPVASLGWFYLAIAVGGALGGVFTAILAPLLFRTFAEFPILLSLTAALLLVRGLVSGRLMAVPFTILNRAQIFALSAAALIPFGTFNTSIDGVLEERRSFYGVLRVSERSEVQGPLRTFTHGQTQHGTQFVNHPDWPTTYYAETSGVAHAIGDEQRIRSGGVKVGLIGLGAGTLAHYARPPDLFRFYELNPDVEAMSRRYFTYLEGKNVEVVQGDARVSMAAEPAQHYDLLVVDAFSSDSIPVHLLTREAADLYARHVKPEGAIVIHISNRVLELEPVTRGIARHLNRRFERTRSGDQPSNGAASSVWVRLMPGSYEGAKGILWTDAYSSLWSILKIR